MRIGLLVYALDRPLSGISRYTCELAQAFAELNDESEITLLTCGGPGPLASAGLKHVNMPGCRKLPALLTLGNVEIPLLARRLKLDILHDTTGVTPFALGAAHARKVVTLYDVIPWSFPGVSTRLDTLIYRHWLPTLLPSADAILTISKASKDEIARHLHIPPERIHIVYSGVNKRYQPASSFDIRHMRERYNLPKNYILFLGSVEERKNLRRVLEAYAQLKKQGAPHQLVIAGPHKWKYKEIMAAVDQLQLKDTVTFTGYVQDHDLPALYTAADVFVFPSLAEGFGLPVLEAMACGAPVVTSNISSLPEAAGDAAILVDPYDSKAISTAMKIILEDENVRQDLRSKGFTRAQEFSWQSVARKTLDVYQKVSST